MNENRSDDSALDPATRQTESKPCDAASSAAGELNLVSAEDAKAEDPQEDVIVAVLAETGETIRAGSPFAVDPLPEKPPQRIEPLLDVGPMKYTAMGAVAAAALVLVFAVAAAWWFPAGGALIAALGCVLSIFGIYSHYRVTAGTLLALHLCLFVYSYGQSL